MKMSSFPHQETCRIGLLWIWRLKATLHTGFIHKEDNDEDGAIVAVEIAMCHHGLSFDNSDDIGVNNYHPVIGESCNSHFQ